MTENGNGNGNGEASVWRVLGPYLVTVVLAFGGVVLSLISAGNAREIGLQAGRIDKQDVRIVDLERTRLEWAARLKGMEVDLSYVRADTTETRAGVVDLQKSIDSFRVALMGNGK